MDIKVLLTKALKAIGFQRQKPTAVEAIKDEAAESQTKEKAVEQLGLRALEIFMNGLITTVFGRNGLGEGTHYTYQMGEHKLPGSETNRMYFIIDTEDSHMWNQNKTCVLLGRLRDELIEKTVAAGLPQSGIGQSIACYRSGTVLGRHDRLYIENSPEIAEVVSKALGKDGAATAKSVKSRFEELVRKQIEAEGGQIDKNAANQR